MKCFHCFIALISLSNLLMCTSLIALLLHTGLIEEHAIEYHVLPADTIEGSRDVLRAILTPYIAITILAAIGLLAGGSGLIWALSSNKITRLLVLAFHIMASIVFPIIFISINRISVAFGDTYNKIPPTAFQNGWSGIMRLTKKSGVHSMDPITSINETCLPNITKWYGSCDGVIEVISMTRAFAEFIFLPLMLMKCLCIVCLMQLQVGAARTKTDLQKEDVVLQNDAVPTINDPPDDSEKATFIGDL